MIGLILAASLGQQVRHCQPVRVQQARATYAAPAQYVQQQAAYAYTAYPYVEKAAFVAVEQVPYYSALVGGEQRGQLRLEEAAAREKELADQIGRLSNEVGLLRSAIAGGATTTPAKPVEPPADPTPAVPPANPPADPNLDAIREGATKVLANKCAKCHTAPVKNDGFVIFDSPGKLRAMLAIDKLAIDHQTYSGEMPQGGPPLEADEYSAIAAWVHADPNLPAAIKACRDKAARKKTD
jgi:hypothetical protein